MASRNNDPQSNNADDDNCDGSFSYFQKTVCLYDWWLIKAENDFEGKRLAVAGLTSRERQAVRAFVSAPIVKRHDVFSLETADGICLIIRGLINEQRTKENGFPSEFFNNFLFGFPPNWLSYAVNYFEGEFTAGDNSGSIMTPNCSPIDTAFSCNGMEQSSLTSTLSASQEEPSGNHEKLLPKARLQNIRTGCPKTSASGGPLKHLYREQNPTSEATENPCGEKLKSLVTSVESQVCTSSKQLAEGSASRNLKTLPVTTKGKYKTKRELVLALSTDSKRKNSKSLSADSKRKTSKSLSADSNNVGVSLSNQFDDLEKMKHDDGKINIGGINDIKQVYNRKNMSLKHERQTRSKTKFKQPPTGLVNADTTSQIRIAVEKDKSNSDRESLSGKKTSRRINFDAHVTPIKKEGQKKISTASPQLSSFKRSRSGRLLLPTMEYWRNQMPVYDADRNITEILEGSSLVSPVRGSGTQPQKKLRQ
ncbi:hypothetical protein L6164_033538 [Bauhinia variegata]|uniref:Uncharacterized protein n=1 Tax=Bauhinia variegata TaxID=167791 RepID=A0ACB9KS82_BAUVA|nr:hypothetical protein L6164_033538 [Bauhinia variegata]